MSLKLYRHECNHRSDKVLVTANYTGWEIEVVTEFDLKSPEFLSKNPTGKLPILEAEGEFISGSNAIIRYLALSGDQGVYGETNLDSGLIDQWVDFSNEIELASYAWLFPIQGVIPNNPNVTKKAQEDIKKILQILDNHLQTRTYLVGRYVSLADISVALTLQKLYELVLDPAFRAPFVNTNRWFTTIVNQPNVKSVVGDVKLAEKAAVPEQKEKAPKKEKAPQPPKEKKEKPEKEKPKEEEEEEEEEGHEEEPKGKNPLDLLPKSSFILDEWKRMYSNNDTRTVALPWFYQHFDKEGYSIWWCDYKWNSDLEPALFKTSNLIGGFFQRLEKLHKYAFGSMIIFGDDNSKAISGIWVFRGLEAPEDMKICDDYENYNWKRANLDDPEEKKLLEDYFAWDGSFGGKTFLAGKVYK